MKFLCGEFYLGKCGIGYSSVKFFLKVWGVCRFLGSTCDSFGGVFNVRLYEDSIFEGV